MKLPISTTLAALLLLAGPLAPGLVAPAAAQVRVAVAGPQSGPLAVFGAMMGEGARRAAEAINARGGIRGEPVEILVRDDVGDPARARTVAGALAAEEVAAVIGHFTAGPSLEAAPLYAEAGIVMITPAVSEPRLTEEPAWNVLRLAADDSRQGVVAARHIAARDPNARVAIVHDKSGFGKGVADDVRATLDEAGIVDVFYGGLDTGEPNYRGLAARIAAAEPDTVYFGGLAAEAVVLLRDLRAAGSDATLVATDAIVSPGFAALPSEIAGGTLMTAVAASADIPAATTIAGAILAEAEAATAGEGAEGADGADGAGEGEPVALAEAPASIVPVLAPEGVIETLHPVALNAYAALEAYAAAANDVGLDGRAVAARLREAPVDTVLGPIVFDEAGDVTTPRLAVHEWRAGPLGGLDYLGNVVE
ncbi:branched-chain amino acid ABC transporter substrate-binding protein [Salinarimonas sp.]|uniref:branched-chain amino acid ABC transporter substrate-binding protein n=1 Tax=Salinarimonas sp. TaxID=2766526 RepID=UPI0032D92CE0